MMQTFARNRPSRVFGFTPDMVVLGKVIGGGRPIGAISGRAEVMAVFDSRSGHPRLSAGGTFTANPVTMAAGLASMTLLTPEAYTRLGVLGDRLRAGLTAVFRDRALPMQVTGVGSLFRLHMTDRPITGYRAAYASPAEKAKLSTLQRQLQGRGILVTPNCSAALSTAMDESHVETFVTAVEGALDS
jgi:glutamate-1-semialdehyde 2,1-aminomutase